MDIVTLITFLPAVGVLAIVLMPRSAESLIRWFALLLSTVVFAVSLKLVADFETSPLMQFVVHKEWIPSLGISYKVGVDGISLWLIALVTFITPITILGCFSSIKSHVKEFFALMLLLETAMLGAFVSLDLFLFYVFWELMLIPMYFMIGVWGGERRIYATVKFFIYTMIGSLLMLVAIIYVVYAYKAQTGLLTFELATLLGTNLSSAQQWTLFGAFALAFAIKVPMFPFHTWLPDAHVEAPTPGSVILAAVLLKMGTYGFIRFAMPMFPVAAIRAAPVIAILAIIGIIYGACVAMVQKDVKKLVAYSSVSHLGFVMLGLFALNTEAVEGAIYQMINHGISTGALFLLVGVIYERRHTRLISEYGGLTKVMPWYATVFMIVTLSSIGLPPLNGFIGEFLILVGTFKANMWYGVFAATGVVLGAIYMLWMYQRVFFGEVTNEKNKEMKDLSIREYAVFAPIIVAIVVLGVYSKPFIAKMEPSVKRFIENVNEHREEARGNLPEDIEVTLPDAEEREQALSGGRVEVMPLFNADTARMLMPLLLMVAAGCLFLAWGAVTQKVGRFHQTLVVLFHVAILASVVNLWNFGGGSLLGGMLIVDQFALFFTAICTICLLATVLVSPGYMSRFDLSRSEYYAMGFFALAGMFVLVSAHDLMSVFLGLELMSLAIYVMVGFRRRDIFSNEAAMKYFLLGAFAIAFFLYGMSIIYGLCGSLNFKVIILETIENEYVKFAPFQLAVALIIVGFVFKVSAVPFHMWVPDVYQGAPSPVTGFMASAVKAASFAAFLRLFYMVFMSGRAQWVGVVIVLAILTMTVGNVVALVQRNVKRMLAYSSIAHAGYILVGMAALSIDNTRAASSVMFYLLAYAFMTLGAFAVISALERRSGSRGLELEDYAALGWRKPFLGFAMATLMFAMAGIPPTAGFFAKYYVFSAAIEQGLVTLAVIGVLNSALSLYYYLRVVVYMYMRKPYEEGAIQDDWGVRIVVAIAVIATIWLGIGPGGFIPGIENILEWTSKSLSSIALAR